MPTQNDLIGEHPKLPNIFSKWLKAVDHPVTDGKNHRALTKVDGFNSNEFIEWFGRKLFEHHHSDYRIEKLKEKYIELGFKEYAEQHRKLPRKDKTKKGNATEILLTEYVESCLCTETIKVFKLKYNPNVDQAIKGDDTLLINIRDDRNRIYLGEAKFRKVPSKTIVEEIARSLSKEKRPLSFTFLIDELGKVSETRGIADLLDAFIIEDIKGKGNLISVGLLLSNANAESKVEAHLNSDNKNMVFISIGIEKPEDLVNESFEKAEFYVSNPDKI